MLTVESLLNLAWFLISVTMVTGVWVGVRSGKLTAPMGRAIAATLMVAFLLLPIISITDDIAVLSKLTEPEDLSLRKHDGFAMLDAALLCIEMLGVALVGLACMFALRRLRVLSRLDSWSARLGMEEFFIGVAGIRPPPAAAAL